MRCRMGSSTHLQQARCKIFLLLNRVHGLNYTCRICNRKIISQIQQVVCFAFHDSRLLLETCQEAKEMKKIVTLFYLD